MSTQLTRRAALGLLGAAATSLLAACAGGASQPAAPTAAPAAAAKPTTAPAPGAAKTTAGGWPDYYPANYGDIVEASKKEQKLLVYSIMSKDNWKPVLDDFKNRYNWIDVEALDLGSYEVFERYSSEGAGGPCPAGALRVVALEDFVRPEVQRLDVDPVVAVLEIVQDGLPVVLGHDRVHQQLLFFLRCLDDVAVVGRVVIRPATRGRLGRARRRRRRWLGCCRGRRGRRGRLRGSASARGEQTSRGRA